MGRYVATGNTLGTAICEAIGIDPTTVHTMTLDMNVTRAARLTTIGFVDTDAVDGIAEAVRCYTLAPRADWPAPWPPPRLGDVYYKGRAA